MTARALLLIGVVLLVAVASGCGGGDDTFRIGVLTDCMGVAHWSEDYELAAAELPLLRRGAHLVERTPTKGVTPVYVAGRKVELVRGCNEVSDRAVYVDEARRLIELQHVDAVVGAAPIVSRDLARRYPHVPFFALSPWEEQETTLRNPAPNLYRLTPDFGQQAAGLGAYAYERLGWRRATIVAGDQPAGWGGAAAFVAEFCALGGKIDAQVLRDPNAPLPDGVLAHRALAPASDGVVTFLTPLDDPRSTVLGALLDGIDQPARRLLLWDQQLLQLLQPLGRRLEGVATTSRFPAGPESKNLEDYQARYREAFPRLAGLGLELFGPVGDFNDAVEALLTGLERVDGDLSDGRRRLREELARGTFPLPRGNLHLDADRQVVTDVPLARLRWHAGRLATEPIGVAKDVEQTFGGLLSEAPPPGPRSQPCRRATPPPWAR